MVTNIAQKATQSLILVPVETKPIELQAIPAEQAYFTGLLDTGDQIIDSTAGAPSPAAPAAPTMVAYLIGLLDDGEE